MAREHVELVNHSEIEPADVPGDGWPAGASMKVLSQDLATGAVSGILRLSAGWRRPAGRLDADRELLILSGSVRVGDTLRGFGYYEYAPRTENQASWTVAENCEMLYLARGSRPDFAAEPDGATPVSRVVSLDTERMPWEETPIPGPPPGLVLKPLRADPTTGAFSALWSHPSRFPADGQYTSLEFHECVEESYLLSGDMWIGTSGTMVPGSYFWRPPFVSHGPFYSRGGSLTFVHFDGALVNHLHDPPARTPDENRNWLASRRDPAIPQ